MHIPALKNLSKENGEMKRSGLHVLSLLLLVPAGTLHARPSNTLIATQP